MFNSSQPYKDYLSDFNFLIIPLSTKDKIINWNSIEYMWFNLFINYQLSRLYQLVHKNFHGSVCQATIVLRALFILQLHEIPYCLCKNQSKQQNGVKLELYTTAHPSPRGSRFKWQSVRSLYKKIITEGQANKPYNTVVKFDSFAVKSDTFCDDILWKSTYASSKFNILAARAIKM